MGQHLEEFLAGGVPLIGHVGDNAVEVQAGIDIVCFAGCQQRADDSHVARGFVIAAEEVVLATQRDGADFVLGKVVPSTMLSTSRTPPLSSSRRPSSI